MIRYCSVVRAVMIISNFASHSKKKKKTLSANVFFCCRPIVPLHFEQCVVLFYFVL